jgi:hypothetical protein
VRDLEKHGSVATEFLLVAKAGHVDSGAFAVGSSGIRGLGVVGLLVDGRARVDLGRSEARLVAVGVLNVFGVSVHQGMAQLLEPGAELRSDLRSDEVLDGRLGRRLGVHFNLELDEGSATSLERVISVGLRTTYSSSSVS